MYVKVAEVARRVGTTTKTILALARRKNLRIYRLTPRGHCLLVKADVSKILPEELCDGGNEKYLRASQAARMLGVSLDTVISYIKKGRLKAYKLGKRGRYFIPLSSLTEILPAELCEEGGGKYLSAPQVARMLGVSLPTVISLIKEGKLKAYSLGERGRYFIPLSSLKETLPPELLEGGEKMYFKAPQVAQLLGVSRQTITSWIKRGKLKAYRLSNQGRYLIPLSSLRDILPPELYQSLVESALDPAEVRRQIRQYLETAEESKGE